MASNQFECALYVKVVGSGKHALTMCVLCRRAELPVTQEARLATYEGKYVQMHQTGRRVSLMVCSVPSQEVLSEGGPLPPSSSDGGIRHG